MVTPPCPSPDRGVVGAAAAAACCTSHATKGVRISYRIATRDPDGSSNRTAAGCSWEWAKPGGGGGRR